MWAAAKYESFTLCLVHSRRCRPGRTHVGKIPLQLLRCTSGNVAGPEVGLVTTFLALLTWLWKKAKDLHLVKGSYLLCSSSKSEHVISGLWLTMLMQFRNFNLNCYHVGVGSNYTPRILSWRRHGCNTSREINTNIRGGNETEKK